MSVGGGWDEISGGPAGQPRRPWVFWGVAAAVLAVVAVVALIQRGDRHLDVAVRRLPAVGHVTLDQVCPVATDRRHNLTVSFRLANGLGVPARLVRVEPDLILGGMRPVQTLMTSGTCEHPLDTRADGGLAPGDRLLVIFQFEVPAGTCPRPLPVYARLTVQTGGSEQTSVLPILNDLGGVPFATCPSD